MPVLCRSPSRAGTPFRGARPGDSERAGSAQLEVSPSALRIWRAVVNGKNLVFWLAALLSPGLVFPTLGRGRSRGCRRVRYCVGRGAVDVHSRPLPQIPVGTLIGKAGGDDAGPPKGWTNLVMLAKPRLGVGDVDSVSKSAAQYSGTFLFTVLANVGESAKGADAPTFFLEKVAVGEPRKRRGKPSSRPANRPSATISASSAGKSLPKGNACWPTTSARSHGRARCWFSTRTPTCATMANIPG